MPFAPSDIFDIGVFEANFIAGGDGDGITAWNKSSGTISAGLTQVGATPIPILKTGANGLNSQNVALFGGTAALGFGDLAELDFGTGAFSIFIVVKAAVTDKYIFMKDDAGGANNGFFFYTDASDVFRYWNGATEISLGARDANYHLIGLTRAGTGAGQTIPYYDGTAGSATIESRTLSNAKSANLGCSSDVSGTTIFNGNIAAFYIASSVPSSTDRNLFGGYIQTKYGLTIAGAAFGTALPGDGFQTFSQWRTF